MGSNSVSSSSLTHQKPKPRINSMLSIWYGIVIGILQVYLIYQSVRKFVWFTELSWPYQKTPFIELNIYIALIGVAVLMLPFFLAASFLRIGNTANDNGFLGRHLNLRDDWAEFLLPSMLYQGSHGFFRTIWTHSGPTASFIHVISSFCLLLPQTIMEAVLIKYGHLSRDVLWSSDMDFMVSQKDRDSILKILSLGEVDSKLMPNQISIMDHSPEVIRVEFFNYALALFVFAIRYANVFWFTNKSFSILFSIQLILSALHTLISFFAFSILYKLHVFGPEKVMHKNLPFLLNHHITLLLYILSIIILLASSSVFYHYGYVKIASFVRDRARAFHVTHGLSNSGIGWAYFPHCSALAVLLALTASQSSLVHDATLLYRECLDMNLLVYIVSVVIFMLLWIFTWLILTVKTKWSFQLNVNVGNLRMRDLDSLRLCAEISLANPSDINKPSTPLVSSMLVINEGQAFEVSDIDAKRSILENLLQSSHLKREKESSERVYWPRSCPVSETQNSLEPEEQPWLKETTEVVPLKNKVTFQDELLTPRYSTTSMPRSSALKATYRDSCYTQNKPYNIDDGDYALLRCGKQPLNRNTLPQQRSDEKHVLIDFGAPSPRQQQIMSVPVEMMPGAINSMTPNVKGVSRSTDSGYNGTGSSNASCSDSRSTASSNSPPDRTASVEYLNASKTMEPACCSQVAECGCESQQCYPVQPTYGKIGLHRKDSIRSHIEPIYETKRVYDLRHVPLEGIYGDNSQKSSHQSPSHMLNDASNYQVKFQDREHNNRIISESDYNTNTNVPSQQHQNNNNDYGMTIHRRSSIRRSFTQNDTTVQTTPYGRCTNIKINPVDQMPPVPPPLPPLSFLASSGASRINCAPMSANSHNSPRSTASFVSPSNFSPHHATIPNQNNIISPSRPTSNTCSTFLNTSCSLK